jgi:hypothetical protein
MYQCPYSATGDVNYVSGEYWPDTVLFVTSGISATIVQCFLIYRYWKMSVLVVFI